jgi:Ca2+-binding RTX toxin-like protein
MALTDGFNVTFAEVNLLGQASLSAFAGGPIPSGWTVLTPQQLGIAPQYWDGPYFTNDGASAIVLQQGTSWIVSFRGTDSSGDIEQFPQLVSGTYIDNFRPLLTAVAAEAPTDTSFYFTGASLGGGATNQMADIATSQYAGRFAAAKFVAFASPLITDSSGILNIGVENDPIYKAINVYGNFASSLDNLVLATAEYMAGNYDGLHPPSDYAHNAAEALDAFARAQNSLFTPLMSPDSTAIFDAFSGIVQDVTPGRETTGAFYIGEEVADTIVGRSGDDFLDGFGGDDTLSGGAGDDALAGGEGNDSLFGHDGKDRLFGQAGNDTLDGGADRDFMAGGTGDDTYAVGNADDVVSEDPDSGNDVVQSTVSYDLPSTVENLTLLFGAGAVNAFGNTGENWIIGNESDNVLFGGDGVDYLQGGPGNDTYYVDVAADVIEELPGEGTDTVVASFDGYTLGAALENLVLASWAGAINGSGNSGDNYITGNASNNVMSGGLGDDSFVFHTSLGSSNIDTLTDFNDANDTFVLDDSIFTTLSLGTLGPNQFTIGTAASELANRIIYDQPTGTLLYDADGDLSGAVPVEFATLIPGRAVSYSDFFVL